MLLKYEPAELSKLIADMFNEVFEKHLKLEVGAGALVTPLKPSKSLNSLIPVGLLTIIISHHTAPGIRQGERLPFVNPKRISMPTVDGR